MNDNIYWVFEVAINPGRLEDFKSLVSSMAEATQKNEAGTLNYEYAMSEDQQICHFYERYQDSNAIMTHLKAFDAHFAARFWEDITPKRFVIYGAPDAQVKDALAAANPIYMTPFEGFRR